MLVQYGFSFEARTVQTRFSELLATVKSRLPSIWQPPTLPSVTSTQVCKINPAPEYNTVDQSIYLYHRD